MENHRKTLILQRTLGAAVLLAAAAVLVPMFMEGEGLSVISRKPAQIPEEPSFELYLGNDEQVHARVGQAKEAVQQAESESRAAVEDDALADAQANVTPAAEAPSATETAGKPATTPAIAASTSPAPAPAPTSKDTPASPALPPDVAEAWTIQVGSFKDRGNATKNVDQLLARGFRAYLGTQTPGIYRVLVGPEIRRERADQLRSRIATETGMKGIVVRYVP
ncbi:Hypothetical protein HDN1F_16320 [gamma proteobacterium HdN1]|nr:Hypothetical protein HDN1F_16320 [gamma proteobacterium HdN1]